jgi:DNA-binding IclR family transcriptional regulator
VNNRFQGVTKRVGELSQTMYKIQSIDRAMAIMDLLADSVAPRSLAEICRAVELDKSTTHRFLICLLRHGMILRTVKGRYVCDNRLVGFFVTRVAVSAINNIAAPDNSTFINR